MSFIQLNLTTTRNLDLGATKGRGALRKISNALLGSMSGTGPFKGWSVLQGSAALATGSLSRSAAGCTLSSGSGAVGSVINGTTVTATWASSDTNSAGLIVAAINANTTVNPFVGATKYVGTLTLATVVAGTTINVCGYTFTATSSATGKPNEFDISGNDAADATALAAAINACPELNQKLVASSASGVVYVGLTENRAARSDETLTASASTVTCSAITTRAAYLIFALQPGALGNCCTATATGTGVTAFSAVSGKLGGGTGGYVSTGRYLTSDMR